MPVNPLALEWPNANSVRSYPLADGATKTDDTGNFELPDDVLLGLYLPVHAGLSVEADRFFLRTVVVYGSGVNFAVAYDDGSSDPPIAATAVVPLSGHVEGRPYALSGVGDFSDSTGRIVAGPPASLRRLPAGEYTFEYDAGRLDPDVVRPVLRAVTSLVVVTGEDRSGPITGVVELVAGSNVSLSVVVAPGSPTRIRFDAVTGEGLVKDCLCTGEDETALPIRTINGQPPNSSGNFTLEGTECLDITPIAAGLVLTDLCSKPCCGSPELEAVAAEVKQFRDAKATLTTFVTRLEGSVNRTQLTILGNLLNDEGCLDCD